MYFLFMNHSVRWQIYKYPSHLYKFITDRNQCVFNVNVVSLLLHGTIRGVPHNVVERKNVSDVLLKWFITTLQRRV